LGGRKVMAIAYKTVTESKGLVERTDFYRLDANRKLNPKSKAILGQFMTPSPVSRFMASLFKKLNVGEIRLLDAGAGVGSLTAAFVEEICQWEARPSRINATTYELDPVLVEYLTSTLKECHHVCKNAEIEFASEKISSRPVPNCYALIYFKMSRKSAPLPMPSSILLTRR
jgi:adenine-specific DNA-methyltransferase